MKKTDERLLALYERPQVEILIVGEDVIRTSNDGFIEDEENWDSWFVS